MKTDYWIIVVVLLLLTALGGMMGLNTIIEQQQDQLAEKDRDVAALEAQVANLEEQLRPKAYCPPLEQLWVSSGTGYRVPPLGGVGIDEILHRGTDLAAPIGTPVHALLAGRIAEHWVPPDGGKWKGHPIMGGYLVIDHGNELLSEYAHLSVTYVHESDWVEMGQIIGLVGDTGICTGPHLHIAVVVSPFRYLQERKCIIDNKKWVEKR